jgi:hypothetical protein
MIGRSTFLPRSHGMTTPTPPAGSPFGRAAFDRDGHTARTLVRADDLRIVRVVTRAGARIAGAGSA